VRGALLRQWGEHPIAAKDYSSYFSFYEEQTKESIDVQRLGRHFFGNNHSEARGNTDDEDRTSPGAVCSAAPIRARCEAASRKLMQR
jgi:predicted enzyme related to lactoylglutathione lyase